MFDSPNKRVKFMRSSQWVRNTFEAFEPREPPGAPPHEHALHALVHALFVRQYVNDLNTIVYNLIKVVASYATPQELAAEPPIGHPLRRHYEIHTEMWEVYNQWMALLLYVQGFD